MDKEQLRKHAIKLYLEGKSPSHISQRLNVSRAWFYKWLHRYQENPQKNWFVENSRKPKTIHKNISKETEQTIINIRRRLENTKYSQIGAITIQWEFHRLGLKPPPIWTIDRVIKKHGLTKKKEKTKKVVNEYPGYKYSLVHQIDLVGPRFIKNYGRFYCLNIIDIESHCAQVNPIKSKASEYIVNSVIRFWQTFGIPDFIQMDNELSFRGSNRHPHSFGQLIRFVLSQGVTPIFIPQAEPWRNGIIEKFNDTFDKKFFRAQSYKDLDDIRNKAIEFEKFHNNYYRYKANNNKVPIEVFNSDRPDIFLDIDYTLPKFIPLIDGDIILIRLIRSDRKLNIFGESFLVSKDLVYSYIEALISVKEQSLKVFRDNQLLEEFEYIMPVDWL